jgi:NodT family efflux transporter outer membrane factor (OMF) lipoprotein
MEAADGAQTISRQNAIRADWWTLFRSLELDALVLNAIAYNATLQSARAALERSQDSMRAGFGVFFPQVDGHAGVAYQRFSPAQFGSPQPANEFSLFTLSGTVSYALDVWGGARRALESLKAQVDAQRYTLIGAQLMLVSNVINTTIARAAYRAQIAITRSSIVLLEEQLRIAKAQATAGTAPYANVVSVEAQIASTRASVPPLEQKVDQATHLLASLTGRTELREVEIGDLALPRDLPSSLPSALVAQRPDILVAEAELHSANAQIGVATAQMLPNITLGGNGGWNNKALPDLFNPSGVFWSVAGNLTTPIFHGGTLYHQRKAALDARNQAAAIYRQTVLDAFAQVADVLRGLQHDSEAVVLQTESVRSSSSALQLVHVNYRAGIATYLQVLNADSQFLQAQLGLIQAKVQRLQDTVALYVALGGGWWHTSVE